MVKVTQPLYSKSATGTLGGLISFGSRAGAPTANIPSRVYRREFTEDDILRSYAFVSLMQAYSWMATDPDVYVRLLPDGERMRLLQHWREVYPDFPAGNFRTREFLDEYVRVLRVYYQPDDYDPASLNWQAFPAFQRFLICFPRAIERPHYRGGDFNFYKKDAYLNFAQFYSVWIPGHLESYQLSLGTGGPVIALAFWQLVAIPRFPFIDFPLNELVLTSRYLLALPGGVAGSFYALQEFNFSSSYNVRYRGFLCTVGIALDYNESQRGIWFSLLVFGEPVRTVVFNGATLNLNGVVLDLGGLGIVSNVNQPYFINRNPDTVTWYAPFADLPPMTPLSKLEFSFPRGPFDFQLR